MSTGTPMRAAGPVRAVAHRLLRRLTGDHRWIVVVVHVAVLGAIPVIAVAGLLGQPPTADPALALPVGLAVLVLQLYHGLAVADGRRPAGLAVTLPALALAVYLPLPLIGWAWVPLQACVMASAPLLLRPRPALLLAALPALGTAAASVLALRDQPLAVIAYEAFYSTFSLVVMAATLYGSARLVGVLHELARTRGELAETAVGRERLRVSRDLHDLLGQSLSAISLKGDLALRLLDRDPPAARAEVQGLTRVAREALRGVRAVARDEQAVSLRTEIDGAAALATAAHITTTVQIDLDDLGAAAERMLAWAVREAVANMLRHSRADNCLITAETRGDRALLTVVHDGADPTGADPDGADPDDADPDDADPPGGHPSDGGPTSGDPAGLDSSAAGPPGGHGLLGLAERAAELSGSLVAGPIAPDRFRLSVDLPRGQS